MAAEKFELFMGCLGNGTTVCNKAVMEHGDYKIIAHISNAGNIKWYVPVSYVPGNDLLRIEHTANVAYEWFKHNFENQPEAQQYYKILDAVPIAKLTEICKDKRPIEEKLPELRKYYYSIS